MAFCPVFHFLAFCPLAFCPLAFCPLAICHLAFCPGFAFHIKVKQVITKVNLYSERDLIFVVMKNVL